MSLTASVQELFTKDPVGDREVELESQNLKGTGPCGLSSALSRVTQEHVLQKSLAGDQALGLSCFQGEWVLTSPLCAIFRKMIKAQLSIKWTKGTREEFCPPTHNCHMPHKPEMPHMAHKSEVKNVYK